MHIALNAHTLLLVFALVLGILGSIPVPSRINLLGASWVCYLLACFFVA